MKMADYAVTTSPRHSMSPSAIEGGRVCGRMYLKEHAERPHVIVGARQPAAQGGVRMD